jgi:hypothetical protein
MKQIETTLKNFSVISEINKIFPNTESFEYTSKGVIRTIELPRCPSCDHICVRNGWDPITRKGLFLLKIGKCFCQNCFETVRPELKFWEKFIDEWEYNLTAFFLNLTERDLASRTISKIMEFIIPMNKDSILRRVFFALQKLVVPKVQSKFQIVHYDEQHPKKGRLQKYRLTLICAITKNVIADELYDDKSAAVIETFMRKHLDINKETIIITDDCKWYDAIFKKIWGNSVKHQLCLLHLDKLIVKDTGKLKTMQELYTTYLLLDIFFDRSKELQFIAMLLDEESKHKNEKDWLKKARNRFYSFVRNLEKMRRRNKENHRIRLIDDAVKNFEKLKFEKHLLEKPLQNRLDYIQTNWSKFTLFYTIKDCPHTNNIIENYFSTSLKTHKKKQFRTDKGIENRMLLAQLKKNSAMPSPLYTFLEWGRKLFILIT